MHLLLPSPFPRQDNLTEMESCLFMINLSAAFLFRDGGIFTMTFKTPKSFIRRSDVTRHFYLSERVKAEMCKLNVRGANVAAARVSQTSRVFYTSSVASFRFSSRYASSPVSTLYVFMWLCNGPFP